MAAPVAQEGEDIGLVHRSRSLYIPELPILEAVIKYGRVLFAIRARFTLVPASGTGSPPSRGIAPTLSSHQR